MQRALRIERRSDCTDFRLRLAAFRRPVRLRGKLRRSEPFLRLARRARPDKYSGASLCSLQVSGLCARGGVRGEIWRIRDMMFLVRLDRCQGGAYIRERGPVLRDDGRRVTCLVYRYGSALPGVPVTASADYVQWMKVNRRNT
ncbi:MAG: gamma-glutamylcyclotransferase [Hyphomonadaceae bacterium]